MSGGTQGSRSIEWTYGLGEASDYIHDAVDFDENFEFGMGEDDDAVFDAAWPTIAAHFPVVRFRGVSDDDGIVIERREFRHLDKSGPLPEIEVFLTRYRTELVEVACVD